jgi:beta-lactamase regulating signal transducer with metallopeptidase domain
MTLPELLLQFVLRSLALACVCAAAVWLLRSHAAHVRFLIWKFLLLSLFALPVLMEITPPITQPAQAIRRLEITVAPVASVTRPPIATSVARPTVNWTIAPVALYLLVTLILLLRLAYNLRTLHKIAARSRLLRHPDFHDLWLQSEAFLKPRLAVSPDITSPVSFDAGDTWILFPPSWPSWDEPKLRAVLTHELAHIQRDDFRTLFLASLATCLFWFHPLAWFLQKQLAALAEEACDEVVLTRESTPEQYANFLIDFARDVQLGRGRLTGAIAVTGNSLLKRRIEKLFTTPRPAKGLAALALILFIPALYLTAAARSNQTAVIWPQKDVASLSPIDIANLESDLRTHPEDLKLRMELLVYYSENGQDLEFTNHLLWFIQNHPEVSSLPMAQVVFKRKVELSDESRTQIQQAWEQAVAAHPESPAILSNAAAFLKTTNPERALELLKQAKTLDPPQRESYDRSLASLYAAAGLEPIHPGTKLNNIEMSIQAASTLRADLQASRDPALLSETGQILASLSLLPNSTRDDPQFTRGLELIQQAITLDPANPKWTEALQSAKEEPARRASFHALMQPQTPLQPGTVRLGAKVAEASLISKTDPVYPPLALQSRIQGTVEFTVLVGTDGKVEKLSLVRGHPLLVNAAKDSILTYAYHPAMVDGKPIPFETQVLVPFQLNDSTKPLLSDTPLIFYP